MDLIPTFNSVTDVESYVSRAISHEFLGGASVRFDANSSDQFNSIGSRCILDRASVLNIDPQKLVEPILKKLADDRFTSERGFLNFSDNHNPGWILTKEHCFIPQNLSIYIFDDRLSTLARMRLSLMATLQTYLFDKNIQLHKNLVGESTIDQLVQTQPADQHINILCGHEGLSPNLFNKVIKAPARAQGKLSFQVVSKPYLQTKIISWSDDYLEKICVDKATLLSAAFYYSMPIYASDLDPLSCFLDENANLFCFGNRLLSKIRSLIEIGDDSQSAPKISIAQATNSVTWPVALSLKLLPLRLQAAICKGDVFAFTQGVYQLLTCAERILNTPDFRVVIKNRKLTPIDQFIVNRLVNQLDLIFNYEP